MVRREVSVAQSTVTARQCRSLGAAIARRSDAILRRDYPVIQGIVLLFSFVYVLVNLVVDLVYTMLDPRIRY